ncbi:AIPR family protein [Paenibacillus sp. GCM10012307]|uniref:AIPR family protein n=1 Tax=Paenibacillus roseus TaxID=2798579 RepID=A0A934J2M1_9BACL|nr:AIPR family protein [Paenibacillus roseus]MBJ6359721.1 AIPR family protein [Paenibacillus roseus]
MGNGLTNTQVLLNAYIKQEHEENPHYSREDDFFEFFAVSQVLKEYDLSDEEIENGLCDATLDGGCDGIFLFADGSLLDENASTFENIKKGSNLDIYIFQTKNTVSFREDALMKWKTTCSNLFDMDKNMDIFKDRYNSKVRSLFELFRKVYIGLVRKSPKVSIRFCYVTKGSEVHSNVQKQAEELCLMIKELFPNPSTSINVNFIGANRLYELANKIIDNEFTLVLSENPITNASSKVFVALVNLAEYYKFMVNENNELIRHIFEANVRDYQGNVQVNKDINDTLENSVNENFWWLNNGATIIASNATLVTGKTLVLNDPEIVNGLQTSTEIYNYFTKYPERLEIESRDLLVRVIVPTTEDSRDKIIFATNNQTPIQKSSLRATDTIHRQIEMYFKGKDLYYDRRKNYYKNNGKKPAQIVSLPFLSQCLIAVLLQSPNDSRARPSTLLADDDRYDTLYKSDQDLDVFYHIAYVGKLVENILKTKCDYTTTQASDIKFYVLYTLFAKLSKKIKVTSKDVIPLRPDCVSEEFIVETATEIFKMYTELGGTDRVAKSTELITTLKSKLELDFLVYSEQ